MKYRWDHPTEWLTEKIAATDDPDELRGIASVLAINLPGDAIQDIFEAEMAADGYFKPLTEPIHPREPCPQCGKAGNHSPSCAYGPAQGRKRGK